MDFVVPLTFFRFSTSNDEMYQKKSEKKYKFETSCKFKQVCNKIAL